MSNISKQTNFTNIPLFKKLQLIRNLVQISIFILLIAGFYSKIRPGFIILLPLAFVAGNFFCGWICPFGSTQEFVGKLGSLVFKKKFKTPTILQKYLQYSRYILAIATLFLASQAILDLGFLNSYKAFMHSAAGKNITVLSLTIMSSFLFIGMFFDRPFCNFFCPEGIRHGLLSLGRIFTIKRAPQTCISCRKCDQICPMQIKISTSANLRHAHCINCFKCLSACPVAKTLTYGKVAYNFKKLLK